MQAKIETQTIGILHRRYRVTVSAITPNGTEITATATDRDEKFAETRANEVFDATWAEMTR